MIPIGDSPRSRTRPWVTYAIIAANLAAFLYMLSLPASSPRTVPERRSLATEITQDCYGFRNISLTDVDRFVCQWSFQPREWFDGVEGKLAAPSQPRWQVVVSILTATFMHAGWLHIFGNMLFLWVFGDNVEDRLGHALYLAFYLVAGIAASFVQGVVDTASLVPNVGASGAVAAVLGAYLVFYPRATVNVVIPFFILIFIPIPIPAVVMIGLWFLQNLLSGFASISDAGAADQGVAWFAHVGGFVFGIAVAFLAMALRPRAAPRWDR